MFLQFSDVYLWCNLPTFPHAALSRTWQGKGGKRWIERGSQSTRLQCQWVAPLPRGKRFRRGRADGWRAPRKRLVPGRVEGEPTARISSPASTRSCCRTLAKSHILSVLPFIVRNTAGVPSAAPAPWQLSSSHICPLLLPPFPQVAGHGPWGLTRRLWSQEELDSDPGSSIYQPRDRTQVT